MVNSTSNEQQQHEHDPSGYLSNPQPLPSHHLNGQQQTYEPFYQPNVAEKNLKVASVSLPNGHKREFHIHVSLAPIEYNKQS